MEKNLLDVFLEYTRGNPLWDDFINALDEFNQEQILSPIKELESIRNINSNTDPVFIDKTIRQLGLTINNQLLSANRENIHKLFHMLPLYHELSGTPKFPRFIEFLLGRGFRATPMYTVDYQDFYAKPKGKLVTEGGLWYSTSHIELSVDAQGIEDSFSLRIERRDLVGLLEAGFTQEQINELRGVALDSNIHDRFIVEHIIHNRIIELYYEFAPIEDVVKHIALALPVSGQVFIAGSVTIKPKEYIKLDENGIKRLELIAPSIVYGLEVYSFNMKVVLSDDSEVTQPCHLLSTLPEGLASNNGSNIVFNDVMTQTEVQVTVLYQGTSFHKTVQLIPLGVPAVPDSVFISGKRRVLEGLTAQFKLYGDFGFERKPVLDQDNVEWLIDTDDAYFEGSILHISEIYAEQSAVVTANYFDSDNVLQTNSISIDIINSVKEVKPIDLTINVPTEMLQGQNYTITVDAKYSDGSVKEVSAHLKAVSNKAKFNFDGVVYSPVVSRDYDTTFIAEFQDKGVALTKEQKVTFVYPKLEVFKLTALVPDSIEEGTRLPLSCIAHWCKASDLPLVQSKIKTEQQVQLFTSETQAAWKPIGIHTFAAGAEGFTSDTEIVAVEDVTIDGNLLIVPQVDQTSDLIIEARITTESGLNVTTTKYIQIKPIENRIESVKISIRQKLFEGESNTMAIVASWSDDTQTELKIGTEGSSVVSAQVLHEDGLAHPELYFEDNILRYTGTISGISTVTVYVQYTHINLDGEEEIQSIQETALVSVVPKIVLTDSIRVFAPESRTLEDGTWAIPNRSRMFIRTEAEFEDGTVEDIKPVITPSMFIPYKEQDVPINVVTGDFALRDMVNILTNKTPEEIYAELAKKYFGYFDVQWVPEDRTLIYIENDKGEGVSTSIDNITDFGLIRNHPDLMSYVEFEAVKEITDFDRQVTRTLVQASKVNEETEIELAFRYFKEEMEQTIFILERETQAHNLILSKRITGPMEFYGNVPAVSYALYVNFDDRGEEYGVSNDWELTILNKREVMIALGMHFEIEDFEDKTDETLNQIMPDRKIVDIDENGYVYPKENVDALLNIKALYDDGKTSFERDLDVQMRRANTYLERLSIVGPSTIEDIDDVNLVLDGAMSHVPYKLLLWRVGATTPEEVVGFWTLEQSTSSSEQDLLGINVGEGDGKLYIKTQVENQDIFLVAYYEEQFDDRREWLGKRKRIFINANRAVNKVKIDPVGGIINDNGIMQLNATVTLEDGSQVPLSPNQEQTWIIVDSPEGLEISDSGLLTIPKLHTNADVTVSVNVFSGSISVEHSITFLVTARNALQGLRIAGYKDIRDDSVIQTQAVLFRSSDTIMDYTAGELEGTNFCNTKECVTNDCQWSIKRVDGLNTDKVSINEATGLLTVGAFDKDFGLEITAEYAEPGQPTVTHSIVMVVHSSLPRFGIGDYGIINEVEMNTLSNRVNNLDKGGSFNINAEGPTGSTKYGYFAHRKEFGRAVVKSISESTDHGSWDGANWSIDAADYETETERQNAITNFGTDPIEIEVSYDNSTDIWYLYRTEKNNFGFGEFAYYYTVE